MSVVTDELPEGWELESLSDILENLESGSRPKGGVRHITEGVPSIGGEHVKADGSINFEEPRFVPGEFAAQQRRGWIKPQDILIVKDGATTGKTGFAPDSLAERAAMVNEHVFCCRTNAAVLPRFVYHFCRSREGQSEILANFRGAAQGGIIASFAKNVSIPIAPLSEQRRIVAKLEALQARSRKAREALEAIPPLLEQFRQSVLAAAFRGDLTANWREQHPDVEPASVLLERIRVERRRKWEQAELAKFKAKGKVPKDDSWKERYVEPEPVDDTDLPELPEGWCWTVLDELVEVQLGQRRAPEYAKLQEYPYIRSANITWEGLDVSDIKMMGIADPDSLQMQAGDVLLNEASGSPTEVGKPVLWRCEIPNCCFQATVLRLRTRTSGLRPEWLFYNCLRDAILAHYAARTPGIGIIHLTAKLLRTWPLPLAPIEEQDVVIARLKTSVNVIPSLERTVAKSISELIELDQSILAQAFRGELVPQDPNDEPASVLLERIKTERLQKTNDKPVRGRRKRTSAGAEG